MKRSFSESLTQKSNLEHRRKLKRVHAIFFGLFFQGEKMIEDLPEITCHLDPSAKPPPILSYYQLSQQLLQQEQHIQDFLKEKYGTQILNTGRVVVVNMLVRMTGE